MSLMMVDATTNDVKRVVPNMKTGVWVKWRAPYGRHVATAAAAAVVAARKFFAKGKYE